MATSRTRHTRTHICYGIAITFIGSVSFTILFERKFQSFHKPDPGFNSCHDSDIEGDEMNKLESELFIEELQKDELTSDVRRLSSGKNSRLHLDRRAVALGEVFRIRIHLYDDYNQPLHRGGDLLAVLMDNTTLGATSVGRVIDHRNGSYTAMLRAMWRGTATISVTVLCGREAVSTYMRLMNPLTDVQKVFCVFEFDGMRTETIGYPSPDPLEEDVCNMTSENYGLAWYCVKPDKRFLCSDWVKITKARLPSDKTSSKEMFYKSARTEKTLHVKTIQVFGRHDIIVDERQTRHRNTISSTWKKFVPEGFLYKGQWYIMPKPLEISVNSLTKCLSNRNLLLFGDSTLRQFYSHLFKRLQMESLTGNWTTEQWHRQSRSQREDLNFKMSWTPHELPLYFGDATRATARPVYVNVDEIPSGSNDLVVIHMYAHFTNHQPHVYRESIRRTANAVKRLLQRSPKVIVGIKGPHYYTYPDNLAGGWSHIYDTIIREEFRDVSSKVIYINAWDVVLASKARELHPVAWAVEATFNSFLNDAC
ncbi:NXPE family member 3-like [Haliotis rubra]|uniref:NXPE family member 3-like n=1 Tax=Haliotis rubra TaxID=36100 RepID=UPI001EE53C7E|nr:NXPE family member 3-like [Haliotis rubra]